MIRPLFSSQQFTEPLPFSTGEEEASCHVFFALGTDSVAVIFTGVLMSLMAMIHRNQFWDAVSFRCLNSWRCRQSKFKWNLTENKSLSERKNKQKRLFFSGENVNMNKASLQFLQIAQNKDRSLFSKTFQNQPWKSVMHFCRFTSRCEQMEERKSGP